MSNVSQSPPAERPRTPAAINHALAHLTTATEALQELHARGTGVKNLLKSLKEAMLGSTAGLLDQASQYEALREQLEEEERARQAAEHPLGQIPAEVEGNDIIPYLHAIDQHLRQLQERGVRSEARQETLIRRMSELEELQQSIGLRMGQNLELARDTVLAGITPRKLVPQPTTDEQSPLWDPTSNQSSASATGDDTPTPAPRDRTPLPLVNKLRKTPKDDNMKKTSGTHSRKASLQRSIESGKTLSKRAVDVLSNPFHRRRSSEGVTPMRNSFSFVRNSRMASITEQNAAQTAPEEN